MLNLLLFYKPIRSSSGAIHSCMCLLPVDASSYGLHIYLAFVSTDLLVFLGEVDSPPIFLHPPSGASRIWPFGSFSKLFHTLDICLRWILRCVWSGNSLEGLAPFLRVLLLLNVSDLFGRSSKSFGEFFWLLLYDLGCRSCLISSGFSASVDGLPISDQLYGGIILGSWLYQIFPILFGGLQSYWKDWFSLQVMYRKLFSLPLVS